MIVKTSEKMFPNGVKQDKLSYDLIISQEWS